MFAEMLHLLQLAAAARVRPRGLAPAVLALATARDGHAAILRAFGASIAPGGHRRLPSSTPPPRSRTSPSARARPSAAKRTSISRPPWKSVPVP
ncbi:MAG: hypothetical protein U0547_07135 [Dehalococcoidia bacterium]